MKQAVAKALAAGAWIASAAEAAAEEHYGLQEPVTPVAIEIYDLHTAMMWVCAVIFVVVFSVMFYSIWKHRKSVGHKAEQFHESTTVEIAWTVVPLVILVAMAIPATRVLIELKNPANADITIKATGYQWKWGYDYLQGEGAGINVFAMLSTPRDQIEGDAPKGENYLLETDNVLVVPVGKKIRILTTADDVIHGFWVPAFGIKQDAIPGFVRDTWFRADKEGTYRGQCAELCGKDHGFMPIVVDVVSAEKYTAWVNEQKKKSGLALQNGDSSGSKAGS
jgi:cytochrome c oxidase subunit 2